MHMCDLLFHCFTFFSSVALPPGFLPETVSEFFSMKLSRSFRRRRTTGKVFETRVKGVNFLHGGVYFRQMKCHVLVQGYELNSCHVGMRSSGCGRIRAFIPRYMISIL